MRSSDPIVAREAARDAWAASCQAASRCLFGAAGVRELLDIIASPLMTADVQNRLYILEALNNVCYHPQPRQHVAAAISNSSVISSLLHQLQSLPPIPIQQGSIASILSLIAHDSLVTKRAAQLGLVDGLAALLDSPSVGCQRAALSALAIIVPQLDLEWLKQQEIKSPGTLLHLHHALELILKKVHSPDRGVAEDAGHAFSFFALDVRFWQQFVQSRTLPHLMVALQASTTPAAQGAPMQRSLPARAASRSGNAPEPGSGLMMLLCTMARYERTSPSAVKAEVYEIMHQAGGTRWLAELMQSTSVHIRFIGMLLTSLGRPEAPQTIHASDLLPLMDVLSAEQGIQSDDMQAYSLTNFEALEELMRGLEDPALLAHFNEAGGLGAITRALKSPCAAAAQAAVWLVIHLAALQIKLPAALTTLADAALPDILRLLSSNRRVHVNALKALTLLSKAPTALDLLMHTPKPPRATALDALLQMVKAVDAWISSHDRTHRYPLFIFMRLSWNAKCLDDLNEETLGVCKQCVDALACVLDGLETDQSDSVDKKKAKLELSCDASTALLGFARNGTMRQYLSSDRLIGLLSKVILGDHPRSLGPAAKESSCSPDLIAAEQGDDGRYLLRQATDIDTVHLGCATKRLANTAGMQLALMAANDARAAQQLQSACAWSPAPFLAEARMEWDQLLSGPSALAKLIFGLAAGNPHPCSRLPQHAAALVAGSNQQQRTGILPPNDSRASADGDSLLRLFEQLQSASVPAQEDAMSLLIDVVNSAYFVDEQHAVRAIGALVAGLSSSSLRVQTGAAELLKWPLIIGSCQQEFLETGALQGLLDMLHKGVHKDGLAAAQAAAAALTHLVQDSNALQLVVQLGGVKSLVELLDESSESLQEQVVHCLMAICASAAGREAVRQCNGPDRLQSLLESPSADLQDLATAALAAVHVNPEHAHEPPPSDYQDALQATRNVSSFGKDEVQICVQTEGPVQDLNVQHLLQQLRLPQASEAAKTSSMRAILQALQERDARSSYRESYALKSFIDLLHSSSTQLQLLTCSALGMLATDSQTALAIAGADALEPLKRIVEGKASAAVHDAAMALNLVLAGVYDYVSIGVLHRPHIPSLEHMTASLSMARPQQHLQAAAALARMTKFHHCQVAAVRHVDGLLPALVMVVQSTASPPPVVAEAMTVLANLTQLFDHEMRQKVFDAGAWSAVCGVLSTYSVDESKNQDTHRIWSHAALALHAMALPDENGSSPVTDSNGATIPDVFALICLGFFAIADVRQCSSPASSYSKDDRSPANPPSPAHQESLLKIVQRDGMKPLLGLLASSRPSTQAHAAMWAGFWAAMCYHIPESPSTGSNFAGSRDERSKWRESADKQLMDLQHSKHARVREASIAAISHAQVGILIWSSITANARVA